MESGKGTTAAMLALALLGITGCAGDDGQQPQGQPGAETSSHGAPPSGPTAGGSDAGGTDDEADTANKAVITIEDFQYDIPASVSPGETITVVNKDTAPHTVTSKEEGAFDAILQGGETITFTAPEEPGEYPFFCVYHPNMTGTLVVKAAAGG